MKTITFSFIIPVYNRPDEIKELLESFLNFEGQYNYEIVIIEDGSTETSEHVVEQFMDQLNISYYFKPNSGPGDSRNYGMQKAKGNYYIILDSDVLLPSNYLIEVDKFLETTYYDCFGGPDAAHSSFTNLQKAINFAMTSFITTGGIRGGKQKVEDFQPRSFNMGLSKKAFLASGGFGKIHPGEDPDLSLRLHKLGFKTTLIQSAFVYHKRRVSWSKFYKQVNKFGMVRPILNQWHPSSKSVVYWFPTLFSLGFIASIVMAMFHINLPLYLYSFYLILAFVLALISNRSLSVAFQALLAIIIQFFGYGYGFLKSTFTLVVLGKNPEESFPHLFFKI
ncbi:cellulose synthase/poly-beta-1,6-N-acetylglucosamine synthase-like glycosyltransferase [Winogradskyella eximia]|uniref:Cellulose synthase/poly-beta-1,6-N-acetylglucosamine synthase-like glycosyltransferase n=1 Tax=Winogradskyella eximia TaxID=262006 RepID=A0A3D9GPZ2_9FLAO|nr:glycosyltransferase [Winogradskyella eximia]RED38540.1 cellulose synthase/poly-beta-1,6-N-acetylglucosamine synthase-like glycosyltransferase [Winogradskyella eximia]